MTAPDQNRSSNSTKIQTTTGTFDSGETITFEVQEPRSVLLKRRDKELFEKANPPIYAEIWTPQTASMSSETAPDGVPPSTPDASS
jgi:hypothetical protein